MNLNKLSPFFLLRAAVSSIADQVGNYRALKLNNFFPFALLLSTVIIIADQISKYWIMYGLKLREYPYGHLELSPIVDLTFVWNRGVSFGMFAADGMLGRVLLSLFALLVIVLVLLWLLKADNRFLSIALGMIIGGAIGNLIDRIQYGMVVDFINFSDIYFIWVFNIADASISIGAVLILIEAIVLEPRRKRV
ncbi:MAG: signal peptidase II [Robiginitomaculum sp.]|nr:signal peptidase II [Robiginitomaculum sp.]